MADPNRSGVIRPTRIAIEQGYKDRSHEPVPAQWSGLLAAIFSRFLIDQTSKIG
jgi:hypothetical protein